MADTSNRKWLRAPLVCVSGGCAYGVGLRANHATTAQAILGGALIATIALSGIATILLAARLILQFRQRNYQYSLGALLIVMTLIAATLILVHVATN